MTTDKRVQRYDSSDEQNDDCNNSLNELADRINSLHDQLTKPNIESMVNESRQKLAKWRNDCYNSIDQYCEEKSQEFDRHVTNIVDKQRKEINRLRLQITALIHKPNISSKDVNNIKAISQQLELEVNDIKDKYLQVNTHSLAIDDKLIQIQNKKNVQNRQEILPAYKTIHYLDESSKILSTNERCILIHHHSNICLLDRNLNLIKQRSWTQGTILDMCWSTTLSRFFILTRYYLHLIDENTMLIVRVQKIPKLSWWSCTSSEKHLYISTKDAGANVYQFTLWPSIQQIKTWKTPETCKQDEIINNMVYHKENLALTIYNRLKRNKTIELRRSKSFECIWSFNLDHYYDYQPIRCCIFNQDEWLLIDSNTSNIFHLSDDGKLKYKYNYNPSPICASLFVDNVLVISTVDGINIHRM